MTTALARRQSPLTSHDAARALELSGIRRNNERRAYLAVVANPGRTAGELGALTGLGRYGVAPRLTGLKDAGRVIQGDRRRCTVQGTAQVTWWPLEQQAALPGVGI